MKIRNGFVSNSSSSSFCIYGTYIQDPSLLTAEFREKLMKELGKDSWEQVEEDCDSYEMRDTISDLLGMSFYGYEHNCIGLEPDAIGDDETGRQFKNRVQDVIRSAFDCEFGFGWHEECYYD